MDLDTLLFVMVAVIEGRLSLSPFTISMVSLTLMFVGFIPDSLVLLVMLLPSAALIVSSGAPQTWNIGCDRRRAKSA